MARRTGAVHVVTTKRQHKGKEYVAHLLRRSYREEGKVKNETVANLSHLPEHVVDLIRQSLRGQRFVEVGDTFDIVSSPQHGNVQAVLAGMRALDFAGLIASRPSRERDLVMAMVAARLLNPQSKLATTRWWHDTTLPRELGVADASEDDLYAAMDWLLEHQPLIEKKLAARHLHAGGMVLYDLSSSYFEGSVMWLKLDSGRFRTSTPTKMAIGMIVLGLGFGVLWLGQQTAESAPDGKVGPLWLATVYFIHTVGELCLSPIGLSMVTKLAPARIVSLMMGLWFGFTALANYLAGKLESIVEEYGFPVYGTLIATSIGAGVLLLALTPLLKRWMHGRG